MKKFSYELGINTGFAVNRFPEPEKWLSIISEVLDLKVVQFVADLLNPSLPDSIIKEEVDKINKISDKYDVKIASTMTSAFTRVNHLSHPNEKIRKYWLQWFKKFIDMSSSLGASSMASHLGILSYADLRNEKRRKFIFSEVIRSWQELASYANEKGLEYLCWEPMSIAREYGETIENTKRIHEALNENTSIPILLCLDVDHGDINSVNPEDKDPYSWLRELARLSPLIHLKQSARDKSGHFPFTKEENERGIIEPAKVLQTLKDAGARDNLLLFEFSFREREPADSMVIEALKESVLYWKPHIVI